MNTDTDPHPELHPNDVPNSDSPSIEIKSPPSQPELKPNHETPDIDPALIDVKKGTVSIKITAKKVWLKTATQPLYVIANIAILMTIVSNENSCM